MNGLEALEKIDMTIRAFNLFNIKFGKDRYNEDCKSIEEYDKCHNIIERELKVLQILKEKKVNLDLISTFTIDDIDFILQIYNKNAIEENMEILTKDEVTLIVEWLKGEE